MGESKTGFGIFPEAILMNGILENKKVKMGVYLGFLVREIFRDKDI